VPVIASTLTIPLLAERVDEVQAYGPYLACALHQSLFLLAIYAVTFLISSVGTNPNRIAMGVLFVAVFQFALYMIKTVTHWSLFRLCDLDVLIALYDEGEWHGPITAALVGAVVLALAGSLAAFARRTP
jgi:hypothetical protein